MKCFYHESDFDGKCSGAIVKCTVGDIDLIGFNYGREFPWDDVDPSEDVFMCDCSMPIDDMVKLAKRQKEGGGSFIWIDHHKSIIDEFNKLPDETKALFDGIQEIGLAGCELTWKYFYSDRKKCPDVVRLLGIYDTWRFDGKDEEDLVKALQYGLRSYHDTRPEYVYTFWNMLFQCDYGPDIENQLTYVINEGYKLKDYQDCQNADYCAKGAFEVTFFDWDGKLTPLNCIAMNNPIFNTDIFKSLDFMKYDAMICFNYVNEGYWRVSLYSEHEHIDVSKYAKSYGGGGHRGASGFQCKTLPFKLG